MAKKRLLLTFVVFGLLLVYFLLLSNILASPITLEGVLVADSKILADDGKTYTIINPEKTPGLFDNIGKRVEATGVVEDSEGEIGIILNSLKILGELSHPGRS